MKLIDQIKMNTKSIDLKRAPIDIRKEIKQSLDAISLRNCVDGEVVLSKETASKMDEAICEFYLKK